VNLANGIVRRTCPCGSRFSLLGICDFLAARQPLR